MLISDYATNTARVRSGQRYGIEVEVEGLSPDFHHMPTEWSNTFNTYWRITTDGSLRNDGAEFVSKPLTPSMLSVAVDSLWTYMGHRFYPHPRCGIHVHANCLGLSMAQVNRILMHYALLEPEFVNFAGQEREENIFCIPWYRAHTEVENIRVWTENRFSGRNPPSKYSALFVGPLASYGTIEFRSAPTWQDKAKLLIWLQFVSKLWATHNTDYDILAKWQELGPVGFSEFVLPIEGITRVREERYYEVDVEAIAETLCPPTLPGNAGAWGRTPELSSTRDAVASYAASLATRRAETVTLRAPRYVTFDELSDGLNINEIINNARAAMDAQSVPPPEYLEDPPDTYYEPDEILDDDEPDTDELEERA